MTLSFSDMIAEVDRLLNNRGASFQPRIEDALNRRYKAVLRAAGPPLTVESVSVAAGEQEIGIPQIITKVKAVGNLGNDTMVYAGHPANQLRRLISSIDVQGLSCGYSPLGSQGVIRQPASAGQCTIVSSDSDTTNTLIRGNNANLVAIHEILPLGGASATTSVNSYTEVIMFSNEGTTTGVITLKDSSSNILSEISAGERAARYEWIKLDHPVDAAITLTVVGEKHVPRMVLGADVPILRCEDLLVQGAFADGLRGLQQHDSALQEERLYQNMLDMFLEDNLGAENEQAFYPDPGFMASMRNEKRANI